MVPELVVSALFFGAATIASIIFSLFSIVRILATKEKLSGKGKKLALSIPLFFFAGLLVYASLEILLPRISWLGLFYYFILSIPAQISVASSIFLTVKILKGNTIIKEWGDGFKAAYVATCIVALLYFTVLVWSIIADILG